MSVQQNARQQHGARFGLGEAPAAMLLLRCAALPPASRPPPRLRRRSVLRRGASFDAWSPADAASFAPFAASSEGAVAAMLSLAALRRGESLLDLGCGDGRVLLAALAWGARGVTGWELDAALCAAASEALERATRGTAQTARVRCGDCRDAAEDAAAADVVTLFLLPEGLDALTPVVRAIAAWSHGMRCVARAQVLTWLRARAAEPRAASRQRFAPRGVARLPAARVGRGGRGAARARKRRTPLPLPPLTRLRGRALY